MLEDKTENNKASKPVHLSPQSSILDFFASPITSKCISKKDDHAKTLYKPCEKENEECQTGESSEVSLKVTTSHNSVSSVILLNEGSNSRCDGCDADGTPAVLVNGTDEPELLSTDHKEIDKKNSGKDVCEKHVTSLTANSGKIQTSKKTKSTETKDEHDEAFDVNETMATYDKSITDSCKRKRKNGACDTNKRKKKKNTSATPQPKDDEDSVETKPEDCCHGNEVSYEAFMQSLTADRRDSTAGAQVVPSPNKDVGKRTASSTEEGSQCFQPETVDVKASDAGGEDTEVSAVVKENTDVTEVGVTKEDCNVLCADKTPVKRRKKTAKSLFKEDKDTVSASIDEEVVVPGGDDRAKNPSILNFFRKLGSNLDKKQETQTVTVSADVHQLPNKERVVEQAAPDRTEPVVVSPKSPGIAEMDNAIEVLGTEMVVSNSPKKKIKLKKISKRIEFEKLISETHDKGEVLDEPKSTSGTRKSNPKTKKVGKDSKAGSDSKSSCWKSSAPESVLDETDESVDSVTVEKVEVGVKSVDVEAFLKSSGSSTVPVKSAQATLSFTKKTTKTSVPQTSIPQANSAANNQPAESASEKKVKNARKLKKKAMKRKSKKSTDWLLSSPDTPTVKYRVSSFQFDDARQTPIRMKLRLKKYSSADESDFTPKSKMKEQKQTKAQKLLKKAKKVKTKQKNHKKKPACDKSNDVDTSVVVIDTSSDSGGRRRSARLASHVPDVVINVDEVADDLTPVKTKKVKQPSKKDTPKKTKLAADSPKKQKSKAGSKLAPIFMGSGKQVEESKPEDPEKVKLRNAFLMSDIPDALRRQAVATVAMQNVAEHTELPTISHTQQKADLGQDAWLWNLPEVNLSKRSEVNQPGHCVNTKWQNFSSCRDVSLPKTDPFKEFCRHKDLSASDVEVLLKEVETTAAGFNVQQTYSDTCRKLRDDLASSATDPDAPVATNPPAFEVCDSKEKSKKKCGRRGKRDEKLSLTLESSRPVDDASQVGDMLWTERYQPTHSAEVVGHAGPIQKLKSWLLEWKHRTRVEANKMRKQMLKQARPNIAKDEDNAWLGEDSDFDSEDGDSEEDDSLCNTMLITGPQGVGKTATVYALAQELGYKVIEVNAASSRNGKKILSKLQEATQSHQVSGSKDGNSNSLMNTLSNSPLKLPNAQKGKKESKLPTAFTNLFKKSGCGSKTIDTGEVIDVDAKTSKQVSPAKSKRKRKREKEEEKESRKKSRKDKMKISVPPPPDQSSQSTGLELSSTTLILFDEAEICFDEDKGYLPAIQHFMTGTKIPIILTTTDGNFGSQLQARFETLLFKQPPLPSIAALLQTICLTENVRTCTNEMMSLVRLHKGDIRQCLLWLQYWLHSGGGTTKVVRPSTVTCKPNQTTCPQDSQSSSIEHDDDDFVVRKPSSRKSRRIVDEDSPSDVMPSDSSGCLPLVQCLRLESVAGVGRPLQAGLETVLHSYFQGTCPPDTARDLKELCGNLHKLGMSVVSANYLHLLPLLKVQPQTNNDASPLSQTTKKCPRSRIRSDLYDDEASNDDVADSEVVEMQSESAVTNTSDRPTAESCLSYKCLKSFSNYYDTLCSIDVIESNTDTNSLLHQYSDSPPSTDWNKSEEEIIQSVSYTPDPTVAALTQEVCVELELLSGKDMYGGVRTAVDEYRNTHEELPVEASLIVPGGVTTFSLHSNQLRISGALRRTHENVSDCLPLNLHCSKRLVHLDYLPSLRAIGQAERYRQVAKTKRRFHHYFDNIGLSLKESSLNVLCQTLT